MDRDFRNRIVRLSSIVLSLASAACATGSAPVATAQGAAECPQPRATTKAPAEFLGRANPVTPDASMPPHPKLSDEQVWQMVAYVRQLGT